MSKGLFGVSTFDRVIMGGRGGEFLNGRRQDKIIREEQRIYSRSLNCKRIMMSNRLIFVSHDNFLT